MNVNVTLSVDERIVRRARENLRAQGRSVNDEIRSHLRRVAGEDDIEQTIDAFLRTSGRGKPDPAWKWNRDEIYEGRLKWKPE